MELINWLFDNWMVVSFLAPALWALVNIIDIYFVDGIYRDEWDGAVISGVAQLIPWPVMIFIMPELPWKSFLAYNIVPSKEALCINWLALKSIGGGLCFSLSFFFYFRALFRHNDVALVQIIWNLSAVFVPLLAFVIEGEVLGIEKYVGIGVILTGAMMLSLRPDLRKAMTKTHFLMLIAVILLSLSMVLQQQVYDELKGRGYVDHYFWLGYFLFSIGSFVGGCMLAIVGKRNPCPMIKRYWHVFIIAEGMAFIGNMSSQRAISISPSVSFVSAIETFQPVYILVFSVIVLIVSKILQGRSELSERVYGEQVTGWPVKVFATIIMAIGVYLIK